MGHVERHRTARLVLLAGAALASPLTAHLERGGGIVVFHHGAYQMGGKDQLLELVGVQAGSIAWDTTAGQRVFAVAPGHFITTQGVSYDGMAIVGTVGPPEEVGGDSVVLVRTGRAARTGCGPERGRAQPAQTTCSLAVRLALARSLLLPKHEMAPAVTNRS